MAWSLVGGRFEVSIPETAVAALEQRDPLTGTDHVRQDLIFVIREYLRPNWHFDDDGLAAPTMAVTPHAVNSALGLEMLLIAEINEGV